MKSVALFAIVVALLSVSMPTAAGHSFYGLNVSWRLPLNIGVPSRANSLPMVADAETIYTTDANSQLFAVDSAGAVRWSQTATAVRKLHLYKDIPGILYVESSETVVVNGLYQANTELFALNTENGAVIGRLSNITGTEEGSTFLTRTGQGFATITTNQQGVVSTDKHLNLLWNRSIPPPNGDYSYFPAWKRMTSSKDTIAGLYSTSFTALADQLVTFDVTTGAVLCNISNISFSGGFEINLPFSMSWDTGLIIAAKEKPDLTTGGDVGTYYQFDARTCKSYIRGIVNQGLYSLSIYQSAQLIHNTLYDVNLTTFNLTTGHYRLSAYTLGDKNVSWVKDLPHYGSEPAAAQPPLLTSLSTLSESAMVIWNGGVFIGLDRHTGDVWWSFNQTRVPVAPGEQIVFPFGTRDDTSFLIPNLEGFVTINTINNSGKGGSVGVVVEDHPLGGVVTVAADKEHMIAVIADTKTGDLIAVRSLLGPR